MSESGQRAHQLGESSPAAVHRIGDTRVSRDSSMHVDLLAAPADEVITLETTPESRVRRVAEIQAGKLRRSSSHLGRRRVGRQRTFTSRLPKEVERLTIDSEQVTSTKRVLERDVADQDFPDNAAPLDKPNEALSPSQPGRATLERQ